MYKYLYRTYLHYPFLSVIIRTFYSTIILLYFAEYITKDSFEYLANIMLIPLITGLFGPPFVYYYANSIGYTTKYLYDIYSKYALETFGFSEREHAYYEMFSVLYKSVLLGFIFSTVNLYDGLVFIGAGILLLYLILFPPDTSYTGKKLVYNKLSLYTFLILNSLFIYVITHGILTNVNI